MKLAYNCFWWYVRVMIMVSSQVYVHEHGVTFLCSKHLPWAPLSSCKAERMEPAFLGILSGQKLKMLDFDKNWSECSTGPKKSFCGEITVQKPFMRRYTG